MSSPKAAPKKLVTKTSKKVKPAAKEQPRRQMTVEIAEKRAIHLRDGHTFDSVAFLRTLR